MTVFSPEADKNLCGQTEVWPSPPCRAGNFQARLRLLGQHRHVIYRWKALVLTKRDILLDFESILFWAGGDLKPLHSKIFDFVTFLQEKIRAVNFLAGRTTFESGPSCGRAVFFFFLDECRTLISSPPLLIPSSNLLRTRLVLNRVTSSGAAEHSTSSCLISDTTILVLWLQLHLMSTRWSYPIECSMGLVAYDRNSHTSSVLLHLKGTFK